MKMKAKKGIMRSLRSTEQEDEGEEEAEVSMLYCLRDAEWAEDRKTQYNNENNHKSDVKMINNGDDSLARLAQPLIRKLKSIDRRRHMKSIPSPPDSLSNQLSDNCTMARWIVNN